MFIATVIVKVIGDRRTRNNALQGHQVQYDKNTECYCDHYCADTTTCTILC